MLKQEGLGNTGQLLQYIIEGILEKKGKEVINIDLRKLDYAACDNFVICHGESGTQVKALAGSVEDKVEEKLGLRVKHREGLENASWILLDYGDIVAHIFVKEARDYYKLEDLWGDADINLIQED
jgi:ribosome-associated protein